MVKLLHRLVVNPNLHPPIILNGTVAIGIVEVGHFVAPLFPCCPDGQFVRQQAVTVEHQEQGIVDAALARTVLSVKNQTPLVGAKVERNLIAEGLEAADVECFHLWSFTSLKYSVVALDKLDKPTRQQSIPFFYRLNPYFVRMTLKELP